MAIESADMAHASSSVLPRSALLTFLIADVRAYTRYTMEHGDEAAARLADRFASLCEEILEAHQGQVIELRGDEALAVFSSARNALRGAVALQQTFRQALTDDPSLPLAVGMGLDAGEAIPVRGGYRGRALNLAARLCSIAGAGEILASEGVSHLAGQTEGVAFIDRGAVTLKGLSSPVRVVQIAPEGEIPAELPPLQPIRVSHPTNLPDDPTPFIGREGEVATLAALLRAPHIRLMTLTGPGGTGKTRLALQLASILLYDFPDGVFFCDLAPLANPALVPSAIARVLGVQEDGQRDLIEVLIERMTERQLLLVLDNFEHLLEARQVVARMLDRCRDLHILGTSRVPLHLSREHEHAVPPLAIPDPRHAYDAARLSQCESVALFIQRAKAAKGSFALTDETGPAVAEICSRLDGLPLAIELAAARIKLFPPQALLQRLNNPLTLLTGGAKDRPSRQQTLRAAIDWSYSLLTEDEQTLFARLAVFAGGWTFEAAETVCNAGGELDLLKGMTSLVDKSLVRQEGEDEPRFSMLETLRGYAAEKLSEDAIRHSHAAYFTALGEEAEPELRGPAQVAWLARLNAELDNLRAALSWAVAREEPAIGLRLATALWRFWYVRGHLTEGRRWLEDLLALAETERTSHATEGCGSLIARARIWAAALAMDQGDYGRAVLQGEQALSLCRKQADTWGVALSLNVLGSVAHYQGNDARAAALCEEGLALFQELGDTWGVGLSLNNVGMVARSQGATRRAATAYEESLAIQQGLGDRWSIAILLDNLGELAQEHEEYGNAMTLHEASLALRRELGDLRGLADSLSALALAAGKQGNCERAARLYQESLTLYWEVGDKWRTAVCLEGLAGTIRRQEQMEQAARLLGAASVLRDTIGHPLSPADRPAYDREVAAVRRALGDEAFAAAWTVGTVMSLDGMAVKPSGWVTNG